MDIRLIKIGMSVRYESQKWEGIVEGVNPNTNKIEVRFKDGIEQLERIEADFLNPFNEVV